MAINQCGCLDVDLKPFGIVDVNKAWTRPVVPREEKSTKFLGLTILALPLVIMGCVKGTIGCEGVDDLKWVGCGVEESNIGDSGIIDEAS